VIVLTRQDVLAHQREVPRAELYQVEQDLLLCLAMHAIFSDRFLAKEVAMRGGTVLHKVHLAPAARYSHYMGAEGTSVPRAEFIAHLEECLADRAGFCTDMTDLLRVGVA
jgi:hypothetical protein